MKKILALCLVLLMATGCSGNNEKEEYDNALEKIMGTKELVVVTSPDYAPYEFIDTTKSGQEQYVGSDIELAKYIAEKLGVTLKIEAADFEQVLIMVQQGKADLAISGLSWKPDRQEAMELTKAYTISEDSCHGVLVKAGKKAEYNTLAAFEGKKVAAQNASLQQGFVETQLSNSTLEVISNLNDGVLMVMKDKVDGLAIACTTGSQYVKNYAELTMSDATFVIDDTMLGNVIGIKKGETELLDKMNEIIDEILADKLYTQWEMEMTAYADNLGVK